MNVRKLLLGSLGVAILTSAARFGSAAEPSSETLFVSRPLTQPGEFTIGIEGPNCDARGNIYAVNFRTEGTIGIVTPEGRGDVYVTLPKGSDGNGIVFDRKGTMFVADYTGHNVLSIDPATRAIRILAHEPRMRSRTTWQSPPTGRSSPAIRTGRPRRDASGESTPMAASPWRPTTRERPTASR